MNSKILPYEIRKGGYFPADTVSLTILNSYNDQFSYLYSFYNLFAFECTYQDDSIIYNVELDWECPTLCRKEIPRSILHNMDNFSIIDFIISAIDEEYYIYITLDSSKINCYHGQGINFMPHPLTIYGYNQKKREFYIADYFNGSNYYNCTMSYDEFTIANNSVFLQMKVLDPLCGTNDSILDIELIKYLKNCNITVDRNYICHAINLFLDGRCKTGSIDRFILNRTLPRTSTDHFGNSKYYEAATFNESYGINVFWGIVQHLQNCICSDKYIFNFRHVHLINLYYELFIKRMLILKREIPYLDFKEEFRKILSETNRHKESLEIAVLLSIKYSLKKQHNSTTKDYLLKINNIIKEEIHYIAEINYIVRDAL